ncbi:MAG: zinc-dependent peptidase [Inhella sp.]
MQPLFLARKRFHTSGGLQLTDAIALAVAAQACLPVLRLDLALYDGTVGIVLHPGEVLAPREEVDEHGVVHQWDEVLAGEAMPGGPLMLSWEAVQQADDPKQPVFNVVVHEFVHLLDLRRHSDANGLPEIGDPCAGALAELPLAWDRFADRVAHREPSCIDPMAVRPWTNSSPWRRRPFRGTAGAAGRRPATLRAAGRLLPPGPRRRLRRRQPSAGGRGLRARSALPLPLLGGLGWMSSC